MKLNYLKKSILKIIFILLFLGLIFSCGSTRKLSEDEFLLLENDLEGIDSVTKERDLRSLLELEPNASIFGFPLRLNIYNFAIENPRDAFKKWIDKKDKRRQRWESFLSKKQLYNLKKAYNDLQNKIKDAGEAPSVVEDDLILSSKENLEKYYWNHGWFDAEIDHHVEMDSMKQTARISYKIKPKEPYKIDSIKISIDSKDADSIYRLNRKRSFIKSGDQFLLKNFDEERNRITENFRRNGLYHFNKEMILFNADTLKREHSIDVELVIKDRQVTRNDSIYRVPYQVRKISEVNLFTDHEQKSRVYKDSVHYEGYTIYGKDGIKFKPEVLTDAVFIKKGDVFNEEKRSLTYQRIANMGIFDYPSIRYQVDPRDESGRSLIANVLLSSKKRFGFEYSSDIIQSNIQDFGIGLNTSFLVRNLFKNAETLELSGRGNFGSSNDVSADDSRFFNISEFGLDLSLNFPKIKFPLNTSSIIDNTMSPFTRFSLGFSTQQNIGLDRRNLNASLSYRWKSASKISHQLSLADIEFINNLNSSNYFNVFQNSFNNLNRIAQDNSDQVAPAFFNVSTEDLLVPEGTRGFINSFRNGDLELDPQDQQDMSSIVERRDRLTENNLIIASNYNYNFSTKKNIDDKDFSQFRLKLELAGNLLSLLSSSLGLEKNERDNYQLFNVQFSQYAKTELNFIKHFDLGNDQVLATRAYSGIALPYGNANSIPFIRSFFAGGPNDNRGWQPYDLGPGSTNGVNDFNEANFKLAFNAEYRFNILGSLYSALFVDAGNIWNVANSVTDPDAVFNSFSDLSELSIASGFGLRYDVQFFVIRVDLGFKTYNPGEPGQKWFRDYNFANTVFNFGINYPF